MSYSDSSYDEDDPWTYYGLYSENQISRAEELLKSKEINFYKVKIQETEERLRAWSAWDESSCDSKEGYELWVHDKDVERLGNALADLFSAGKPRDPN